MTRASYEVEDPQALNLAIALGAAHVPFDDVPSGFYVIPDEQLSRILSVFFHLEGETVHACPPGDSGYTPCCDMSPWELPRKHRMTLIPENVTCGVMAPVPPPSSTREETP